jgi:hypothetical protein
MKQSVYLLPYTKNKAKKQLMEKSSFKINFANENQLSTCVFNNLKGVSGLSLATPENFVLP